MQCLAPCQAAAATKLEAAYAERQQVHVQLVVLFWGACMHDGTCGSYAEATSANKALLYLGSPVIYVEAVLVPVFPCAHMQGV